jgi:hypothetical protein
MHILYMSTRWLVLFFQFELFVTFSQHSQEYPVCDVAVSPENTHEPLQS